MGKIGQPGIAVSAGMLLLGVGQEVIELSARRIGGKATVIRQAGMPEAVRLDHGSHREATGQRLELTRATQVATPSASIWVRSTREP